jgi:hypothetical protein
MSPNQEIHNFSSYAQVCSKTAHSWLLAPLSMHQISLTVEEKVKQDIGTIPLVKGKSLISETLCDPFLKEYQKVDPTLWKSKEGRNSSSLQTIQTFCRNCQKRQDGNFASNNHADG